MNRTPANLEVLDAVETPQISDSTPAAALEAFSVWMDEQLAMLVAQWSHLAAPGATRSSKKPLPR